MEIVLAALVAAAVAVAVALLLQRPRAAPTAAGSVVAPERRDAAATGAAAPQAAGATEIEHELRARRDELARMEERLRSKESSLELHGQRLDERERSLDDRRRNLEHAREELKAAKRDQIRELERVAGLSAGQAKQIMMRELEDELRHESARLIRQVEEETRHDADRRSRSTLAAVLLSGFDGVRREIARLTLEKLLQDGRIHPARIEEAFHQAKSEIDQHVVEVGEQAVFEANVGSVHPELVKLLGKLRFRTSYGQNVLHHSVEC